MGRTTTDELIRPDQRGSGDPPTLDASVGWLKSADGSAVQLQTKLAASSVLPAPVQWASAGYGQSGRV